MAHSHDSTTLDLPLPARRHQTLGLVLVRRIAGHGLHDARATMLALDASGAELRRLLMSGKARGLGGKTGSMVIQSELVRQ